MPALLLAHPVLLEDPPEADNSMSQQQFDNIFERLRALEHGGQTPPQAGRAVKTPWTRAERISLWSGVLAVVALLISGASMRTDRSNRADAVLDRRIDERVALARDGFSNLLDKKLEGIQNGIAATNKAVQDIRSDLSKLTGRMDGTDRDVNLLLGKRMKSMADAPPAVLAAELPVLRDLYALADRRNVSIPSDITDALRLKMASINSAAQSYWPAAAVLISASSRTLVGGIQPERELRVHVSDNNIRNARVVLDGMTFTDNVCTGCLIEYHGGATVVSGNRFINCLFVFSVSAPPPPSGQDLLIALLRAQNLKAVSL